MAGLIYYLPMATSVTPALLKAAVLDGVLSGGGIETRGVPGGGPDGNAGMIIATPPAGSPGTAHRIGYFPDKQEWQKAPSGKYWIGRGTAEPVTPEDLARPEMIGGHIVELGDGNKWLIPVARAFPHGIILPQTLRIGPDGELVGETLPKYAAFSGRAAQLWDEWRAEIAAMEAAENREPGISIQDQWTIAAEALGINYRIDAAGISMLGIINTTVLSMLLRAIIDVPTIMQIAAEVNAADAKKNDTQDARAAG